MPSQKKVDIVTDLVNLIDKSSVVGIANLYKLPSKQLFQIKQSMKGKATIRAAKKSLIKLALSQSKKKDIEKLLEFVKDGQPAFLFTNDNPFALGRIVETAKSKAAAKAGDTATSDILVKAGPTSLPAGPAISDLTKAGMPAGVEGGKIAIKKDTIIAKRGDKITKEMADALGKLGIEPMEIGLDLLGVLDNGIIFNRDILFIPQQKYVDDLKQAYINALNLSVNANHFTKDNMSLFIGKAHREAMNLAVNSGVANKETIGMLLSKAQREALALNSLVKE